MSDSKISQLPDGDSTATTSSYLPAAISGITKRVSISKILSFLDLSGYELLTNKSTNVDTDQASNTKYPSVKAVYDWATGLFASIPMTLTTSCTQAPDATVSSGTHTCDFSAGSVQKITATGNFTLAFSNVPAGVYSTFVIYAVNWGAHTVTLPSHLKVGGTELSFTASGKDELVCRFDKDGILTMSVAKDLK